MTWSIQVNGLAKMYRVGRGPSQKFDSAYEVVTDGMLAAAERLTGGRSKRFLPARIPARPLEIQSEHMVLSEAQFEGAPPGHFWALRDVSFRVEQGQRIGIIGRNGSGKSTLLKILSRITSPTQGEFSFRGRLISLLEIGTGFHPDLTGRENVHLNAKINGLTDRQIRSVFDEIVDFSELGVQIDTPIKRYSSGMYMRLAFSVAAHLDSEILVVDEVLAVGDAGFQKKCLDRMLAIGNSGRTLLFVSHDMDAVRKLCSSALELSHGRIVSHEKLAKPAEAARRNEEIVIGSGLQSVTTAIADYSLQGQARSERVWTAAEAPKTPSGRLAIRRFAALLPDGSVAREFSTLQDVCLGVWLTHAPSVAGCQVRLDIAASSGRALLSSSTAIELRRDPVGDSPAEIICRIPAPFFNAGAFKAGVVVSDLSELSESCAAPDSIDIVLVDAGMRGPGLPHAPEAPLIPSFTWTMKMRESGPSEVHRVKALQLAPVADDAHVAARPANLSILVAVYSMSQWTFLGRIAARFREHGEDVGIVYFGPPGPAQAAIRDAAAAMQCRFFDHELLSAELEPGPPTVSDGTAELLAADHPYRIIVRRQLASSLHILEESAASLVIVGEDGIGGDGALIAAARRRGIPALVTPYGVGEGHDYDNFLDDKHREGAVNYVPEGPVGEFVRKRAPAWVRRRPYGDVLVFPAEFVAARLLEGLDQPLPWAVQGGNANLIAVESPAMRRHYLREHIPEAKLADVGTLFCDAVVDAMSENPAYLDAFRNRRKIRAGRTSILLSMPPSYFDVGVEGREFASYEDFCRVVVEHCASLAGAELTISMHPNSTPEAVAAVRATGARISDRWVVELIGQHDIFLTVSSTTIRWAIAAGKPVVNYDIYGFALPTYEGVPGVMTVTRSDAFKDVVSRLTDDDEYHQAALVQSSASADWGQLDGRNFERLRELVRSLVAAGARHGRA